MALAGILVYIRTLSYPFVYDDDSFVVLNEGIRSLSPLTKFFVDPDVQASDPQLARDVYRPLTTLSYALSYRFFGLNPRAYHLVNVLLHILNTLMVFFFISLLLPSRAARPPPWEIFPAFAGALLFLLHPFHP